MKLDLNDPKLTAFALGELEGQEAIEMAKQVDQDPAAQAYVNEIRDTETVLKLELAKEDASARLPLEAREKILSGPQTPWYKRGFVLIPGLAAAAALVLVILNFEQLNRDRLAPLDGGIAATQTQQVAPPTAPAKNEIAPSEAPKLAQNAAPVQVAAQEPADMAMMEQEAMDMSAAAPSGPYGSMAQSESGSGQIAGMARPSSARMGSMAKRAEGYGGKGMFAAPPPPPDFNTERYSQITENGYKSVKDEALSTFSVDVDTASYANVRRYLNGGTLPPQDSVRIEEMLNYFEYSYPQPTDGKPFSVTTEIAQAPWNSKHKLVRIGLKGKEIPDDKRPATNLVFLIDVSGSMMEPNKLPLVQTAMKLLVEKMRNNDRVSIVTYASGDAIALESTSGKDKAKIMDAIEKLTGGGGTNGAAGINSAYKIAQANFIKGGVNRVILSTDGDFNVGTTSESELLKLAEDKAKTGVFLTVLGFGTGNYNDSMMVKLADKGNGNHAYIDSKREAQKVLVEQVGGTLQTIAKDVKIQVEFNPDFVSSYRLIGYEKRMLNKEDFNDDKKDAGEIGSGHTVTALYEVVPRGVSDVTPPAVDGLKYQPTPAPVDPKLEAGARGRGVNEIMTVKLRFKKPDGKTSEKFDVPVKNEDRTFDQASSDMKFAASVAGFGMLLRDSEYKGDMTWDKVIDIALSNAKVGGQPDDNRIEFLGLARKAKDLQKEKSKSPTLKKNEE